VTDALSQFAIIFLDLSHFAIKLQGEVVRRSTGYSVRIISKTRLVRFWEGRKGDSTIAERDFTAWHELARNADWGNFAGLKGTFSSADQVGNCVVFDVGNNRYRLIARINYRRGIIYILRPMDHDEYDKKRWVDDCGCRRPPPKRPKPPQRKGRA
jgi:mRNA interferase HigB